MQDLFTRKPIAYIVEESTTRSELSRSLTRWNLISMGIGCIVGAGIFVVTGLAAANYAGPALILSFLLAAAGCAFAGLCYAELSSMIPAAGSAYTYAYATLGEFVAWIIGWDLILEYLFGASSVAVGWSGYVVSFLQSLGIHLPAAFTSAPVSYDSNVGTYGLTGAIINFPAILIIGLLTALLITGIKGSARLNNFIVAIKLTVIALFILLGMSYINPQNWVPFLPANTGNFGEFGWSGVLRATGVVFFAYIGFDVVSTVAQEAKNPQKDMAWGILGSLIVTTILYIAVTLVMTGLVSYTRLNVAAPIALAVDQMGDRYSWLVVLIKFGAIAGLSSVILILLLGQPRILYSMAKDGLLPQVLGKVHSKYHTPHISTMITGFSGALVAGLFPINLLGELVSIGTLLAFAIVSAGVLVLRYRHPEIPRSFKVPLFPIVPILGIVSTLGMMATLPEDTWIRLVVWMLIGFVIYGVYGRKHSRVRKYN